MTASNLLIGLIALLGVIAIVGAIIAGRLDLGIVGAVILVGGIPLALWVRTLRKSLGERSGTDSQH